MDGLYGKDLFGDPIRPPSRGVVSDRFIVPPFSVLSARDGFWRERKSAWASLGIKSEVGRPANLLQWSSSASLGEKDTSIFDPVLTELVYQWFCPPGGQILDPFAGGSVRGIVASCLGRKYWGSELRPEQVESNEEQARAICDDPRPVYICGDSMETLDGAPLADFIFSCPPYGNLEVYSDLDGDLSNMEWHAFHAAYKRIILRACKKLRSDRFACFVVSDFRDPSGFYRDFVSATISGFAEQGLRLYNEAILVGAVGSASMRVSRQFAASRKLCKTHQNVLIFCKGNWKRAAALCGDIGEIG